LGLPVDLEVIAAGGQLHNDFSGDGLVVGHSQVEVGRIAAVVAVGLEVGGVFVSSDIKRVASSQCDILVLGSVVDAVLSDKLQRTVSFVSLENADSAFGEGNTQAVGLTIAELNFVAGLQAGLGVSAGVDGDEVVLADSDVVDSGNELNLLLRVIVEGHWLAESVHVVVREWLLWKGRSGIGHGVANLRHVHDWRWINWLLDSVDVTSNQLQLSIEIALSRMVVNGHPSTYISSGLVLAQGYWVVRLPWESRSSVSNFAVSGDSLIAKNLPVKRWQGEEPVRERREVEPLDVVEHFDAVAGLQDIPWIEAKKGAVELVAFFSQFGIDLHLLIEVLLQNGIGVDQVGLIVLLEDSNFFLILKSLEGDSLGLDVGRDVCEVEVASALIKGDGANVLDHRELIVIDGDSQWDCGLDGWALQREDKREE
jgi:hypothetical protein